MRAGGGGGGRGGRRRGWAGEGLEGRVLLAAAPTGGGPGRLSPVLAQLADRGAATAFGELPSLSATGGTGVGDGTLGRLIWDDAGRVGVTITTRGGGGDDRRLRR